jgi:hypothetical protein
MPYSIQLHTSLDNFSSDHKALAIKFQEFARFIKDCTQTPSVANHNIIASLQYLEKGFFTTTFASRTISFVFSSFLEESGNLVGNVECFLLKEFPEHAQVKFGGFTFDTTGHTNLKIPNEDAAMNIANDFGTLHIALYFIRESLSK